MKDTRGVIREVISESTHSLKHASWLDLSTGLVEPKAPTKRLTEYLGSTFGAVEHFAASKTRFNDVAWIGDVVALKQLSAGWIIA
eukprot:9476811-Pyramimonas_sp.AAC.1